MNLKDLIAKMTAIEEGTMPPVAPTATDAPTADQDPVSGKTPEEAMKDPRYKTDPAFKAEVDKAAAIGTPPDADQTREEGIEIIGAPMGLPGHAELAKQQDSVSMNVSLNGAGADGVRSLMNILKDIEDAGVGAQQEPEEPIMGDMIAQMTHDQEESMEEVIDDDAEMYGNSAHGDSGHHTHGVDAVTFSGDDMNRSKHSYKHNYRGGDNPMNMQESLQDRLMAMYQTIKEERTENDDKPPFDGPYTKAGEHKKDQFGNPIKHVAKHLAKKGMKQATGSGKKETEKMSEKDVKENAHHADDEEKKIRHLMRKYGWSRQEALEYYHYEEHDPKDYEDMEEGAFKDKDTDRKEKAYAAKQTLKHIKNPTKGEKDAAKDIKPGSYKDRADLLKSAEADGRLDELAKWRDPKYKGQLFTQKKGDSDDYDSIDYGYGIKERPKKDPGQKRSTFDRDTVWTDPLDTRSNLPKNHNDPENWGYGSISSKGDSKGKLTADRRKRMKNDIRGSLGQHHTPNLPEQVNESAELNAMLALNKRLNG
jgi:hypothetical protein